MNNFIWAIILTVLPISELRGGIPVALASGYNPWLVFFVMVFFNCLVIFFVFLFLDNLHKVFIKNRFYSRIFNNYVYKKRKKIEKHIGTRWQFFSLFFFTAVPLPYTGAYTASILAWFFNLERKKSYLAISLGVLTAGIIVSLISLGVLNFF